MLNTKNNVAARMGFDNVKNAIYAAWISSFNGDSGKCWDYVNSLKLSEGSIRLENLLTANNTVFTFGVNPQQQSTTGTYFRSEERLNQQDTFIITSYALFIGKPATSDKDDVNFALRSYANPNEYGVADASLINNLLYSNGKFKLTVNNDVLVPNADLFRHLMVPETQATAAPGAGSPLDEIEGAVDGFVSVEPNLYLIGSKNSEPQVILKTSMAALTSTTTRLVLMFRGYLAQNSTSVN